MIIVRFFNYFLICVIFFAGSGCSENNSDKQRYKEAEALWMDGLYEEAKDVYEKLIEENPESDLYDDAVFRLGEMYYLNLYDDQRAIIYFTSLVHSRTDSEHKYYAHRYMAKIYESSLQDYDKAIIEYQKLIDNYDSKDVRDEYQSRIAYSYFKKGNYYQAIIEFDNLIERYPDSKLHDYAFYQRSNIYYILEKYDKAKQGYNEIINRFPQSTYILEGKLGIAECLDEEGNLDEALVILYELLDVYSNKELIKNKIDGIKRRIAREP